MISRTMKYNGTAKQNKWAIEILQNANLTEEQINNLLRYAGPTMHSQGIMDVTIIIEHRANLAEYADSLGAFFKLSPEQKRAVAEEAVEQVRHRTQEGKNVHGNCD